MNKVNLPDIINANIINKCAFGEIGASSSIGVTASISADINKINNTANIRIQARINSNTKDSSDYKFVSMKKIAALIGYSNISFNLLNTRVIPIYYPDSAASTRYNYTGFSGYSLILHTDNATAGIGRVTSTTPSYDVWPLNNILYELRTIYAIDIYNAILS